MFSAEKAAAGRKRTGKDGKRHWVVESACFAGDKGARLRAAMEDVLLLCKGLEIHKAEAGKILFEEGGKTGRLYFLIKGKVQVCKGDITVATSTQPGAAFGEISLLLDLPHTATVKAAEDSEFYVTGEGREFLLGHPELALFISGLLARRLQGMTNYLVDLKTQYGERDDHLGMVDKVLESLLHRQARPVRQVEL